MIRLDQRLGFEPEPEPEPEPASEQLADFALVPANEKLNIYKGTKRCKDFFKISFNA